MRRSSSAASTYAVEHNVDADDDDRGGSRGGGGAKAGLEVAAGGAVNVDYLDAVIGHDDDHSSGYVGGGSGGKRAITKTFKAPEDEQMRTFMNHKDSVLGDLDTIAAKAEEIRRITNVLDDVCVLFGVEGERQWLLPQYRCQRFVSLSNHERGVFVRQPRVSWRPHCLRRRRRCRHHHCFFFFFFFL